MDPASTLPILLAIAWLLPLVSFAVVWIGFSLPQLLGMQVSYASSKIGGHIAVGAIVTSCLLSLFALFFVWLPAHPLAASDHGHDEHHEADDLAEASQTARPLLHFVAEERATGEHDAHANNPPPPAYAGDWYTLGSFGELKLTIGYYIDTLTVVMFSMVTLIASCVHFYSMGYMHDELHDFTDPEVTTASGEQFTRHGRYHRFFQYLSLFCFSMLGIVIAGNLAMVFVFWELVGICSYFLIGFYIERKSACNAANKAFIVNRVGDFGMLIGLMALWTSLGTFNFGDVTRDDGTVEQGIFSQLRTEENDHAIRPSDGMVAYAARDQIAPLVLAAATTEEAEEVAAAKVAQLRQEEGPQYGQWLLFVAGVGLFCGCVGKSAQFPLHTWLPDAMEGPTPVSALVHSATMVAAGVYLVGRAYPIFTPEALLVIAIVGAVTLLLAATIAITATDIKRVLAYSTVSQLGYMMLALGLGGWLAGMFHLITHAFFKGLLFLCSGSVIHAVHTNDMTEMGGLRKKMPITAYTMLVGCLAIIGAGIPFVIGLSGYYSKDAIIEQALSYANTNKTILAWQLFILPVVGAFITAFYMFRLWYMTFAGEPRDQHRYDHAHESPRVMTVPLLVLAVFAIGVGWTVPFTNLALKGNAGLLEQARPVGTLATSSGTLMPELIVPDEHLSHAPGNVFIAGSIAFLMAAFGLILATIIYLWKHIDPETLRHWLRPLYDLSWHKWWFDELYHVLFVLPTHALAAVAAAIDRGIIDTFLHACAWICRQVAVLVAVLGDRLVIDNGVDGFASKTWDLALSLRNVQTGRLRQYAMFIVIAAVVLFLVASGWWRIAMAG